MDGLVVEKHGLKMTFYEEGTRISFDHLPADRHELVVTETGENAIQWLIQAAIGIAATADELEGCMKSIRAFYAEYLIDKSALNTLAFRLRHAKIMEDT